MDNSELLTKAIELVKSLHPKHYLEYFKLFYQKHGFVKTFLLAYVVLGLAYMILKHKGLWFK